MSTSRRTELEEYTMTNNGCLDLRFLLSCLACVLCAMSLLGCRESPLAAAAASAASPVLRATSTTGIRRTLVGRQPAHEPGWETRLYLVEYPPGATATAHVHPAIGVGWGVDGEFESAFGNDPVVTVRAGQGFYDLADTVHRVFRNSSPEHPLRFVIAYTIRVGDEQLRPVSNSLLDQ